MSGGPSSGHWHRVAHLKPSLRGHVRLHRHVYLGRVWYVAEDRSSGRQHRFTPAAYQVLRWFDGKHTLESIWQAAADAADHSDQPRHGEEPPSQDELIGLLGQLNASDLVTFDTSPDIAELFARGQKTARQKWKSRLLNPTSLRFPMWDPDAALHRLARVWRGLPRLSIPVLWMAAVLPALLLLPSHWHALTGNFGDQVLAADNLLLIALVFPLLKFAHEMAHGLAVKLRDGEVHEMGLMLLLFYPVPYVDASASNAFARKGPRMLVSAAGMLVELWLAALAFLLWLLLEPGLMRSMAYNVVVIGGISTVLFNANPLLRYDGYFILADALEIPNLGARANRYWQYAIARYVFGAEPGSAPVATRTEKRWFIAYAPAALVYRLFISLTIAAFLAQHYFFAGVALAIWTLASSMAWPLAKGLHALWTQPHFVARATRVRGALAVLLLGAGWLLFAMPLAHHTFAEGVVGLPDDALLRAPADGFVQTVWMADAQMLPAGAAVALLHAPQLDAQVRVQEARRDEAQLRFDAAWAKPAEQGRLGDALKREQATLADLESQRAKLTVRSAAAGRLAIDRERDLPGRYLRKGEVIGHLIGGVTPLVRVVVGQRLADEVRRSTHGVRVRLSQEPALALDGRIVRARPKAENELPSAALGQSGGGRLVNDARDPKSQRSVETFFEFDVEMPHVPTRTAPFLGSRAWVRFEHAPEPVAWRMLRWVRAQFLSQFEI
jgi:putative peptide zinc metalloprotease protein